MSSSEGTVNRRKVRHRETVEEIDLSYTDTSRYVNDRQEKSWQSIPSIYIVVLLLWYMFVCLIVQLMEDHMPKVITEFDMAKTESSIFSETAALKYLDTILGTEPRVAGTKYHREKTIDMKKVVDVIAENANQTVLTDWQMVSDDFFLNRSYPYVNMYVDVSNIVAVLEGESGLKDGVTASSILVNCHYDSVPYAIGASDNGVFCAVMAEILQKFSKRSHKFKHNIVFLFNGAEENFLQGSHGFLKHPWATGVTAVVNLDATGMNGKPTVFQSTDGRVLGAYRRAVRRPTAQGLGEVLFGSGHIPSDTDFRIFRDFGQIYGIDIAFAKWGVVYHTKHDNPTFLKAGVVQNAGETVMALLAELADMDEFNYKAIPDQQVYYDYLSLFMVNYPVSMVPMVDSMVLLLSMISIIYYLLLVGFRRKWLSELLYSCVGRAAAILGGGVMVGGAAVLSVSADLQLRYLSCPWLVIPMFWIPYYIGAFVVTQLYDGWRTRKHGLSRPIRCVQSAAASRLLLSAALLLLLLIPAAHSATYVISVPLAIMSVSGVVSLTAVRLFTMTAKQQSYVEIITSIPSFSFAVCLSLRVSALAIPIAARSPGLPPDYTIAVLSAALATLCTLTVSGVELLYRSGGLWRVLCALCAVCVVVLLVPVSPYSEHGPAAMRHYWFHSSVHRDDGSPPQSFVAITKTDVHSTRVSGATPASSCHDTLLCGLPLYRPAGAKYLPQSVVLPSPPPAARPPAPLTHTHSCLVRTCTYYITVQAAPHLLLTLSPLPGVSLTEWSLSSPIFPCFEWEDRPVYVITRAVATYSENEQAFKLKVKLRVPITMQIKGNPKLDISLHSHKIHHPEEFTDVYKAMVDDAPKHYHIASFISFRDDYTF